MTNDSNNGADYQVGYGKPPIEHRFKPGEGGRKKGSRNKLGEDSRYARIATSRSSAQLKYLVLNSSNEASSIGATVPRSRGIPASVASTKA